MKKIRVLIVDDEQDIRELVAFYLQVKFDLDYAEAGTAKEAIEQISKAVQENKPFDICISDFNMPGGKGTKVLDYILDQKLNLPFIYATSVDPSELKFSNEALVSRINKPFLEDDVHNAVDDVLKRILESTQNNITTDQKNNVKVTPNYIPLSIESLLFLNDIHYSLYVKINDESFVRVSYPNTKFGQENYNHYKQKNVSKLYFTHDDYKEFLNHFSQKVNTNSFFKIEDQNEFNNFQLSESILDLKAEVVKNFGWSKEVEILVHENIKYVLYIVEKNQNFKNLLKTLDFKKLNKASTHCMLIAMTTVAMMKELNMPEQDYRNLILAAFFHDVSLTDFIIENEFKFYQALIQKRPTYKEELKLLEEHAFKSSQIISNTGFIPEVVHKIIQQHHERPDGMGYPHKFSETQIFEYAALFIVAENLVFNILENSNWADLKETWSHHNFLNVGKFSKFYSIVNHWVNNE